MNKKQFIAGNMQTTLQRSPLIDSAVISPVCTQVTYGWPPH